MSRLQTLPAEIVSLVAQARDTNHLLAVALEHIAHKGHARKTCTCEPCGLYRRIQAHLRRDQ